jgi:Retroviral aspartyl protease
MVIVGEWWKCDDGETRPIIRASVKGGNGQEIAARFLLDTGADRSAFDATILKKSQLPQQPPPPNFALEGVGGASPFVIVDTALLLPREDGGVANIKGQFAAFTDPKTIDLCILGRDVLQHFDVIVSRRRNQVLLQAANHEYVLKTT